VGPGFGVVSGRGVGESGTLPGGGPTETDGVAAAAVVEAFTEGAAATVEGAFKDAEPGISFVLER